jgi:hypothetical protein
MADKQKLKMADKLDLSAVAKPGYRVGINSGIQMIWHPRCSGMPRDLGCQAMLDRLGRFRGVSECNGWPG